MRDDQRHQFTSSRKQWEKLKFPMLEMRHEPTAAESVLWHHIRNRQVGGAKFRRQHAIEGFVVDFACIDQWLIIEVDGEIHNLVDQKDRDVERQAVLEARGFRVLRFTNEEVMRSLENVLERIGEALASTDRETNNS